MGGRLGGAAQNLGAPASTRHPRRASAAEPTTPTTLTTKTETDPIHRSLHSFRQYVCAERPVPPIVTFQGSRLE